MSNPFFEHPILNSPYEAPSKHWELDAQGQPTQQIIEQRRKAAFITPIPKPRKRKAAAPQQKIVFDEGKGLSTGVRHWLHQVLNARRHRRGNQGYPCGYTPAGAPCSTPEGIGGGIRPPRELVKFFDDEDRALQAP